jgi:hypothetical protein
MLNIVDFLAREHGYRPNVRDSHIEIMPELLVNYPLRLINTGYNKNSSYSNVVLNIMLNLGDTFISVVNNLQPSSDERSFKNLYCYYFNMLYSQSGEASSMLLRLFCQDYVNDGTVEDYSTTRSCSSSLFFRKLLEKVPRNIRNMFSFSLRILRRCPRGHLSDSNYRDRDIFVVAPRFSKVILSVSALFSCDYPNAIYCEACGALVTEPSRLFFDIPRENNFLVLYLRRFTRCPVRGYMKQVKQDIIYDKNGIVNVPGEDGSIYSYRLIAAIACYYRNLYKYAEDVVKPRGAVGHYVCWLRSMKEDCWLRIDDTKVRRYKNFLHKITHIETLVFVKID